MKHQCLFSKHVFQKNFQQQITTNSGYQSSGKRYGQEQTTRGISQPAGQPYNYTGKDHGGWSSCGLWLALPTRLCHLAEWGWRTDDTGSIEIEWDTRQHMQCVQNRVHHLTCGCSCKTGCLTKRCKCTKANNMCGPGCRCINCQNTGNKAEASIQTTLEKEEDSHLATEQTMDLSGHDSDYEDTLLDTDD